MEFRKSKSWPKYCHHNSQAKSDITLLRPLDYVVCLPEGCYVERGCGDYAHVECDASRQTTM
eukprot:2732754-Ditylum_brightwellii.AAC.1